MSWSENRERERERESRDIQTELVLSLSLSLPPHSHMAQVVEDVPYVTTLETMEKYNCDFCAHGGT